jgi:class 3 adenylate cyclase
MREHPSGTVTLLFTDVAGSIRLLHELGAEYGDALAVHRRRLREAVARVGCANSDVSETDLLSAGVGYLSTGG